MVYDTTSGFVNSTSPNFVCKLSKGLYGLKWTTRARYEKLKNAPIANGFENSVIDSSLFIYRAEEIKDNFSSFRWHFSFLDILLF